MAGDGSVVGLDDGDLDAALEVFLEVRRDPRIQLEQATHAAQALEGLGVDLTRPGMDDTPARMARAYAELFSPRPFWATHFPDDEGYDQMVLAKRIPFRSVCEHHMLAFTGVAYLGYLPGDRILGLSKLARLVEHFAAAPQMQERLTQQIADWLHKNLNPRGVGVVVEAEHTCMTLRGVQAHGSGLMTSALLGELRDDPGRAGRVFRPDRCRPQLTQPTADPWNDPPSSPGPPQPGRAEAADFSHRPEGCNRCGPCARGVPGGTDSAGMAARVGPTIVEA